MQRRTITLYRDKYSLSRNSLGIDGLNAMASIPNVVDPEIESETENKVIISYCYTAKEIFIRTDEVLSSFGVTRKQDQ